jgi:hypothetical protein
MGTIGPSAANGNVNQSHFIIQLLKLVEKVQAVPENATLELNWVPVDLLADAMAAVVKGGNGGGGVYHFQSRTPKLLDVFQLMEQPQAKVRLSEWRKRVEEQEKPGPVKDLFLRMSFDQKTGNGAVETIQTELLHPGIDLRYSPAMIKLFLSSKELKKGIIN